MTKKNTTPTNATLLRFNINLDKLNNDMEAWTLNFPIYHNLKDFADKVKENLPKDKYLNIPYRQLNNLLMTVCPTLTHAFEYDGSRRTHYALAIRTPNAPVHLPEPAALAHLIRTWVSWWAEQPDFTKYIPADELKTMRLTLTKDVNEKLKDWCWQPLRPAALLRESDSRSYSVIPSLIATLLHDQESEINGQSIRWRKVQDGGSKGLSIVGNTPLWATHDINEGKHKKRDSGYFAYKIKFNLQTQAGREKHWLFVSLHVQRYGHESLTKHNKSRDVSVLVGANQARLDDFPVDSTAVRLRVSYDKKKDVWQWSDNLAELLDCVGVSNGLIDPAQILSQPQNFWRPAGVQQYYQDEYYIIHAEGYRYGNQDKDSGHRLESGSSMTEKDTILTPTIKQYLPFLEADTALIPDEVRTLSSSAKSAPQMMQSQKRWKTKPQKSRSKKLSAEEKTKKQAKDYLAQKRDYQNVLQDGIKRALAGEKMFIAILWHNEDTRDGICLALEKAFLLEVEAGDKFPANVEIRKFFFDRELAISLKTGEGRKYRRVHKERMKEWRKFL